MRNFINNSLIILILVTVSCSNPEKKFKEAESINTIEAYQKFVREFPESEYTVLAKSKIDSIAYENAIIENTEESYLNYYKTYPDSKFTEESKDKASSIAYANALKENTETDYIKFINKYSDIDLHP